MRHDGPVRTAPPLPDTRITPACEADETPPGSCARSVAARVERVLDTHLAQRRTESAALTAAFADEVVHHLTRLVLGGGKRLRPAFLWCGWHAAGAADVSADAVLEIGAALELLQGCALIHDDLMDSATSRRGRPALHVAFQAVHRSRGASGSAEAFGYSAALLAGDLALAWAQDLWEQTDLPQPSRQRTRRLWQAMRTEMVAGQYLDLRSQADGASCPDEALRTAYLKSGLYTVQRPLLLGATLGGASADLSAGLERVGRCAGLAFQLADDVADLFGNEQQLGRRTGEDVRQGKPTYLMTVALEAASRGGHRTAQQVLTRAQGNPELSEDGLDEVRAAVTQVGARGHVEKLVRELADEAREAVAESAMPRAAADSLTALVGATLRAAPPRHASAEGVDPV
ncbi:polyprenyl synthetase family protein [Streptomyces diacarni]|uniref:Polyprenyl synthetase family protein n=2 Tax=Streptomyces diacarni TaxID=2800381 RepID=A0A367F133_9ACTN|nr:polyprenyl synthetase family protein [Streptomyces diacarni]